MTKAVRYIDSTGRVILPAHIRKALNLTEGNCIEIELEDDGTIRLRPVAERCCICGRPVAEKPRLNMSEKYICGECSEAIAQHVSVMGMHGRKA